MAPTQQDSFIDDSDDACPLCVEEFDLSDKNFKPCPCGYQVCQFCFNNIKNNMNGLCPACRRPYDEKNIEWKVVSPEEVARFKAEVALQAKKKAVARQKEVQKREVETLNRKHLAGLRVVQKNLVYVVGLNPKIREEDLLQTLRGDQYFGQYGKIIKIVVSKKEGAHSNQSMGVYVTFERKQDAASCIAAVDGSRNGDRTLRCMFLHEPGENDDSFTRQDLSSLNVVSTQQPAQASTSSTTAGNGRQQSHLHNQPPQPQPPPQQAPQTVAAAAQPMARQPSKDGTTSSTESGDGSALPSSASWASKGVRQQRSTTASRSASAPSSPKAKSATAVTDSESSSRVAVEEPEAVAETSSHDVLTEEAAPPNTQASSSAVQPQPVASSPPMPLLNNLLESVSSPAFAFTFSTASLNPEDVEGIINHPSLFDSNGGVKRRKIREQDELERRRQEEEVRNTMSVVSAVEEDESPGMSGSLQLGGEPETRPDAGDLGGTRGSEQPRQAIQPPSQQTSDNISLSGFDHEYSLANKLSNLNINGPGITPLQRQQLYSLKANQSGQPSSAFLEQYSPGSIGGLALNPQQHQASPFQNQSSQLSSAQGHGRQSSRFSFANDTISASAAVKPAANAKLMAQQSAMMPSGISASSHSHPHAQAHQQSGHLSYGGGAQGPPPGLKSVGTPTSGGGIFGQGHGFANAMGSGLPLTSGNIGKRDDLMRELLHSRGGVSGAANGPGHDAGKREFMFPSSLYQYPSASTPVHAPGLLNSLYGHLPGVYQDSGPQKQKKKGKKHRHANTSSSGGGGIVDLADPSILQARMHQGGAGTGQGLFGGQGQGDQDLPTFADVSGAVDALVKDDTTGGPSKGEAMDLPSEALKRSSLSMPPGLSLAHGHPLPALAEEIALPRSTSTLTTAGHTPSTIPPAVPTVPSVSATRAEALDNNEPQEILAEDRLSMFPPLPKANMPDPKLKAQDTKIAIHKPEEFPALAPPSEAIHTQPTDKKEVQQPTGKGKGKALSNTMSTSTSVVTPKTEDQNTVQDVTRRQHPGKLDIAAATEATKNDLQTNISNASTTMPTTPVKGTRPTPVPNSTLFRPSTPTHRVLDSPMVRQNQPKTIRVVPTPKTEAANPMSGTSSTLPTPLTAALKQPATGKPSSATMNVPSTPASEIISDNASMTSASLSRPGSPVFGKVGTAPTRINTKSQQKKQRQERAKMAEDSKKLQDPFVKPIVEESVQAPIIGRKKKSKKPASSLAGRSTPAVSRPPSPSITEQGGKEGPKEATKSDNNSTKEKTKAEEEKKASPMEPATASSTPTASPQKPVLTAASIIADLQNDGEIDPNTYDFFKAVVGLNYRYDITPSDFPDLHRKPVLTDKDRDNLAKGAPVHISGSNNKLSSRIMISPQGHFLHGITPEQEQRYLKLAERNQKTRGPIRYNPPKENAFAMIGAGIMQMQSDLAANASNAARRGVSEITRTGEAMEILNHFLPPTPNHSQGLQYDTSNQPSNALTGNLSEVFGNMGGGANIPAFAANTMSPSASAEELEQAMSTARKETEALEKRFNTLLKKNRRMVVGAGAVH
ncbi:MAG: transcriptional repressor general negative regulator of transcription subunit 4 [Candelina submexicana]|nr:MAG: transcriptional repressor general negative regulator of transcription subunit 4 [Candelina submexicana]